MSKYLDQNGLLYLWAKIKGIRTALETALTGKVDKVEGKGLSTNDFTAAEKAKLNELENYTLPVATNTVLGGIKVKTFDTPGLTSGFMGGGEYGFHAYSDGSACVRIPFASENAAGVFRVGAGLTMNEGILSATGSGTADSVDWSNIQNKPDVALKSDLTAVYRYKGSKASYGALPETGNEIGDVWNVEDSGMNYGWTGSDWDALGEVFEIESITNAEIDAITAED